MTKCVGWGVKLYSIQSTEIYATVIEVFVITELHESSLVFNDYLVLCRKTLFLHCRFVVMDDTLRTWKAGDGHMPCTQNLVGVGDIFKENKI